VRPLTGGLGAFAYFGAVVLVLYGIARLRSGSTAMLTGYALSPVVLIAYFLLTACPATGGGNVANETSTNSPIDDLAGTQIASPEFSPLILGAVFALVLVGAAALIYSSAGEDSLAPEPDEDESGPDVETDAADLARAAEAAADRIEQNDAEVDNEVYRAWYEMTELLNVPNPDSSTAGEFAEAAIEAGLGEDHVDELTTLFDEVRYGEYDTQGREERALEVFRDIENEYGTAVGSDGQSDGADADQEDDR
jgi:hypothetical protein